MTKKYAKFITDSYRKVMIEGLQNDPALCARLLNDTIVDEDFEVFLLTLLDIIEAHGGIALISKKSGIPQKRLKDIFFEGEEIKVIELTSILSVLGWRITFESTMSPAKASERKSKKVEIVQDKSKKKSPIENSIRVPKIDNVIRDQSELRLSKNERD